MLITRLRTQRPVHAQEGSVCCGYAPLLPGWLRWWHVPKPQQFLQQRVRPQRRLLHRPLKRLPCPQTTPRARLLLYQHRYQRLRRCCHRLSPRLCLRLPPLHPLRQSLPLW